MPRNPMPYFRNDSPCKRDCPRRNETCHNREYCPAWGEYEDKRKDKYKKNKAHSQVYGYLTEDAIKRTENYRRKHKFR